MNVTAQKFQSLYAPVGKSMAWRNHRTTLPQSRPLGVTAPSGREPGMGACHSTYRPETARLRAIFIAPTKTQKPVPFTIQRGTLPQSRPLGVTAPSEREPGWGCTIQRAARKPQDCGRFSSPLRNSETGSFYHSTGDTPSVSFADSSLREGAGMGAVPFNVPPGKREVAGDFHRPYETQNISPPKNFRFLPG